MPDYEGMGCVAYHLAFRARPGVDITVGEPAARLWGALRRAFPDAFAAALMPDHGHIALPVAPPERLVKRLRAVLARHTTRCGAHPGDWWRGVGEPKPIASRDKLRRQMRYIHLNPTRGDLSEDVPDWLWTTHRDVLGAVIDPWLVPERLAPRVGWWIEGFSERFHCFVSSDWSVSPSGTPFPTPAPPRETPIVFIDDVLAATAVAARTTVDAVRQRTVLRHAFIRAAHHQGWRHVRTLAKQAGVSPSMAHRVLRTPPDERAARNVAAVLLCLGDERLCARSSRSVNSEA